MDTDDAATPTPDPGFDPGPVPAPPTGLAPPTTAMPGPVPVPADAPPMPPATEAGQGRPWRWVLLALGVIALAVAAFALVLYRQEASSRDDAEQALAEARVAQSDAEDRADAAEQRATEAEAARDEAQGRADEADTRASEAEAERDDAVASAADYADSVADFLAFSTATGLSVDDADAKCIADAVVESVGPRTLDLLLEGTVELGDELFLAAESCGVEPGAFEPTDEETALEPGTQYGDNPVLDELYDACEAGDGAACDDLYEQSEIGSDYESFGFTCGDRFDEGEAPEQCEGAI